MSRAIKCDRCGTCFDPTGWGKPYLTCHEIYMIDRAGDSTTEPSKFSNYWSGMDFCALCTESLIKWRNGGVVINAGEEKSDESKTAF